MLCSQAVSLLNFFLSIFNCNGLEREEKPGGLEVLLYSISVLETILNVPGSPARSVISLNITPMQDIKALCQYGFRVHNHFYGSTTKKCAFASV